MDMIKNLVKLLFAIYFFVKDSLEHTNFFEMYMNVFFNEKNNITNEDGKDFFKYSKFPEWKQKTKADINLLAQKILEALVNITKKF